MGVHTSEFRDLEGEFVRWRWDVEVKRERGEFARAREILVEGGGECSRRRGSFEF